MNSSWRKRRNKGYYLETLTYRTEDTGKCNPKFHRNLNVVDGVQGSGTRPIRCDLKNNNALEFVLNLYTKENTLCR